jgi:hypothetical protein
MLHQPTERAGARVLSKPKAGGAHRNLVGRNQNRTRFRAGSLPTAEIGSLLNVGHTLDAPVRKMPPQTLCTLTYRRHVLFYGQRA